MNQVHAICTQSIIAITYNHCSSPSLRCSLPSSLPPSIVRFLPPLSLAPSLPPSVSSSLFPFLNPHSLYPPSLIQFPAPPSLTSSLPPSLCSLHPSHSHIWMRIVILTNNRTTIYLSIYLLELLISHSHWQWMCNGFFPLVGLWAMWVSVHPLGMETLCHLHHSIIIYAIIILKGQGKAKCPKKWLKNELSLVWQLYCIDKRLWSTIRALSL